MFSNSDNLGKLRHTTKDSCPDCDGAKLQLRIRDDGKEVEYLYCPTCGYEGRPEKSKLQGIWKKKIKEGLDYVESSSQSGRDTKRDGKDSRNGNKGYNQRGLGKI